MNKKKVVNSLLAVALSVEMYHVENQQPHVHEDVSVPSASQTLLPPPIMASGSFNYGGWGSWWGVDRSQI